MVKLYSVYSGFYDLKNIFDWILELELLTCVQRMYIYQKYKGGLYNLKSTLV